MLAKSKNILKSSESITEEDEILNSKFQRGFKSFIYLAYRWLIFFFFAFSVLFSAAISINRGHFHLHFIYFTQLNLCGTAITSFLGAILATISDANQILPEYKFWMRLYWLLWNQSIVFSCIISVFYWSVMYKAQALDVNNILIHITNSVVLIFDLLIVEHPPNYRAVIFLLPIEVLYLVFTVLYQFLGGLDKNGENFVYAAADWKNHPFRALLFFICLVASSIILHFTINFIHEVKASLYNRLSALEVKKVDPQLQKV